jgi:hypothetical protein
MTSILGIVASSKLVASGAYESIATLTASGGETSMTFSSIPSTYKHLEIRGISRDTIDVVVQAGIKMRFNGDTGSNYTRHSVRGDGGDVIVGAGTGNDLVSFISGSMNSTTSGDMFGASIITIADYASTTKNKTVRGFTGSDANAENANYSVVLNSSLWLNTAAITSITMLPGQSAFAARSKFGLFGIKG